VDILLELTYRFGGEGMGDDLALAGMFCAITSIEQTPSNRDEGVIVFTGIISPDILMNGSNNAYLLRKPLPCP
jgi:hypothetical protein